MATNPLVDRIMDQLRVKLPGALDGVTQMELWNTVDDFLTKTNVWQDTSKVELEPGVLEYDLTPEVAGTSIRRIMSVQNEDGTNWPIQAWMPVPGTLRIATGVSGETTINVLCALSIGDPGKRQAYPDMPDWIWSEYYDVIIDGVIGRMFGQPAKPYSNPQLAAYHLKSYGSGVSVAKAQANRGRRFEGQRWRFPQGYASRIRRS